MKTPEKFIPQLAGCCGDQPVLYTHSNIQKAMGDKGKSHLLIRNATEIYSAFNYVMFGPFSKECFEKKCVGGGLVCFLFDLVEAGCYRAVFRIRRYKEKSGSPDKFWFHILS